MCLHPLQYLSLVLSHKQINASTKGYPQRIRGTRYVPQFLYNIQLIAPQGDYDVTATVHNDTYPAIDPTKSNFHGKSIFITGGSKGIGLAMSLAFAKAGASNIAVGARSDQSSVEKAIHDAAATAKRVPPRVLPITLDVTIQASVDNAAKEVEKAFGRLDILINNAGILGSIDRVADSDPDAWWNVWTVNFRGSYLVSRAFLPLLLKGGDKTIINVSSVGAHLTLPGASAYQTSKLAMVRFTEFLCADYGDQGVTAFAIHPGNVITDILGPDGPPDFLKHGTSDVFAMKYVAATNG